MPGLTVTLYQPMPDAGLLAPVDEFEGAQVTLSKRTGVGDDTATVALAAPATEIDAALPDREGSRVRGLAHCEIAWGTQILFGGQVQKLSKTAGAVWGFTVRGYAAGEFKARTFTSSDNATSYSSALAINAILTQCFPWIAIDGTRWEDPGVDWTLDTFSGQSVAEAINQILKAGSGDGVYYDFGLDNLTAWLVRRECPTNPSGEARPQYRVPFDATVSLDEDAETVVTDVDVEYQDAGTGTTTTVGNRTNGAALAYTNGRTREITLKAGQMSSADAQALRDSYLTKHGRPLRYGQLTRKQAFGIDGRLTGRGLELDRSGEMPVILVPVANWVGIGDDEDPLWIDSWQWSSTNGDWSATLGDLDPDASLYRTVKGTQASLARQINPVSGGKARA